jgi:hypothetical protein
MLSLFRIIRRSDQPSALNERAPCPIPSPAPNNWGLLPAPCSSAQKAGITRQED